MSNSERADDSSFVRNRYLSTSRDAGSRSEQEQLLCTVYEFVSDVENGGFQQFFHNSSEAGIRELLSHLLTIRAIETRVILSDALRRAEFESVQPTKGSESAESWFRHKTDLELDKFNDRFFSRSENFDVLLSFFLRDRAHTLSKNSGDPLDQ